MMKQISVYFNSDTYLQTESYIQIYADAKKFISIYHNYIHFSKLRTDFVYTYMFTPQVTLTGLDGTLSNSNLSNDEDDNVITKVRNLGSTVKYTKLPHMVVLYTL